MDHKSNVNIREDLRITCIIYQTKCLECLKVIHEDRIPKLLSYNCKGKGYKERPIKYRRNSFNSSKLKLI